MVDEKNVPENCECIELDPQSTVATYGVARAKLQILSEEDKKKDIPLALAAKAGCILVTHHTNNEFNGIFSKLAGIITTDGNTTSHAAQNSYALKIPCIVGAKDAISKLRKLDGKTVTMDAYNKKIYTKEVPATQEELDMRIWIPNTREFELEAQKDRELSEVFEKWEVIRPLRPEVYRDSVIDGPIRLRSNFYRKFQIDYYYYAWHRLTDFLNKRFQNRAKWKLTSQEMVYIFDENIGKSLYNLDPPSMKIVRRYLCQKFTENDKRNIFCFFKNLKDFNVKDLEELFYERLYAFQNFSKTINETTEINKENVERIMDGLIDIFSWMHFGFWLDVSVNHLFAHGQLKYVSKEYHNIMKKMAASDLNENFNIDPSRPDMPNGSILKLSRIKDKEIEAIVELIIRNKEVTRIFIKDDEKVIKKELKNHSGIYQKIKSWSMRFKNISEHLDELSDTFLYIKEIKDRITYGSHMEVEFLADLCLEHLEKNHKKRFDIKSIKNVDRDLYAVICGFIRRDLALKKYINSQVPNKQRLKMLTDITVEEIENHQKYYEDLIRSTISKEKRKSDQAKEVLKIFPNLKRVLRLSYQEFLLREDGHHIIVPLQRKLAKMMLEVGKKYKCILGRPDRVFDISVSEFMCLLHDTNPIFIQRTFEREEMLKLAELKLSKNYKLNPKLAYKEYERDMRKIQNILKYQAKSTNFEKAKKSYLAELKRLEMRLMEISKRLLD